MKIAVYAISKNEEKHVDRFMESAKDADLIVVTDTGSTDNTAENLKTKAIMLGKHRQFAVHNISINPWRFDTARNVALALVPADVDVCIRLDLDEVLDPGWRNALERAWIPGVTTQLWYDFTHSPGYTFRANYIHARHGYIWRGLDHEGLFLAAGKTGYPIYAPGLSITHHQDNSKPRTAILGRLQAAVKEDQSARTAYYLGREYFYYKHSRECIDTLVDYLDKPDADWDVERMDAMSMIAESYFRLSDIGRCIQWYYRAIAEYQTREPYLGLAAVLYTVNNKELAFGLIQHALRLTNKLTSMYVKPAAWDQTPYLAAAACARDLGFIDKAREFEGLA